MRFLSSVLSFPQFSTPAPGTVQACDPHSLQDSDSGTSTVYGKKGLIPFNSRTWFCQESTVHPVGQDFLFNVLHEYLYHGHHAFKYTKVKTDDWLALPAMNVACPFHLSTCRAGTQVLSRPLPSSTSSAASVTVNAYKQVACYREKES